MNLTNGSGGNRSEVKSFELLLPRPTPIVLQYLGDLSQRHRVSVRIWSLLNRVVTVVILRIERLKNGSIEELQINRLWEISVMEIGLPAPGFELYDQSGKLHRLADYQGKWVVLFFYPKDHTPGCSAEVCDFNSEHDQLLALGVVLLGVSTDNQKSHEKFALKHHLKFPILSDQQGRAARTYQSLFKLGPFRFAKRDSFIVDPQGHIAAIYRGVKPKGHGRFILDELKHLMGGE
ncbi:MAG: peroxiredoxin [Candidatus Thiodiazotropha sp.]